MDDLEEIRVITDATHLEMSDITTGMRDDADVTGRAEVPSFVPY